MNAAIAWGEEPRSRSSAAWARDMRARPCGREVARGEDGLRANQDRAGGSYEVGAAAGGGAGFSGDSASSAAASASSRISLIL